MGVSLEQFEKNDGSNVTLRRLELAEEIVASQTLRFRIWSEQEGVALKDNTNGRIADELDATAYHWGAYNCGELIASARLSIHHDIASVPDAELFAGLSITLPTASMNRLVVAKSARGMGIAKALDEQRISYARKIGVNSLVITPVNNPSRIDALTKIGFILLHRDGTAPWSKSMPITAMYLSL